MTAERREQLQDLFREVFDDDALQISESTTAADVVGWDSLMHINLIIATEKRFGVRFATAEISEMKEEGQNVGTFLQVLEQKIRDKA